MPKPASADPYAEGLALAAAGRHTDAIGRFEAALALRPNDARVLFALGATAQEIGHVPAAERFYRSVLAQEPDRIEALVNLANLMRAGARYAEVTALIASALERKPGAAELWLTLGSALREAGDNTRAREFYREALRLRPGYPQALGNLADLIADNGQTDEALALYDQAIKRDPHNAQARLNRAILHLLKGDLKAGWRDYEYRLKIGRKAPRCDHSLAQWNGRELKNKRLLVTAEQGIGDQIMFASMINDLAARAKSANGSILLECEPRLAPLFARSFPEVAVHPATMETRGGQKLAHYSWLAAAGGAHIAVPMGSLPGQLRANFNAFAAEGAFLIADAGRQAQYKDRLASCEGPIIGLCWRSGNVGGLRAAQFAPLEAWAAFARGLKGTLVSLQYDAQPEELVALNAMLGYRLHVPDFDQKEDIDRACALIANLDAVVSAPTAVSWMAAGLGVPTYKILYNTSWTSFGTGYEPFAPACRCMSPERNGDWADVFAKVTVALNPTP